ncbi:ABC transporter substrate-binding protein [Streptomyces scopuliridis]|uniref:ABC transporter substrate-binding protein n=1 Tax=Streptomyces scopuliridis TaxID=452529 RepID=A0ACD4ZUL6_9ACTN|nr:ABC transporter substrate-binding protein [Streptomyces scopuliridis]WSB37520.1 ABC transporter substrate-binding protein [Streptomyces scopuliridis]WSC01996.1 ABC transporter substrate-binding protein [Streptomyces scopuliridis]WSC04467.1 ABC transporter substrate-binding protein [Streptomyces scopuliridis]
MTTKPSASAFVAPYESAIGPSGNIVLKTALGERGIVRAILDHTIGLPGKALDIHAVKPLPQAFRAMVNQRAFHVAEMALTTLAMAIERDRPIIGVPVVLNRDFHYRSIVVRTGSTISEPGDLEGRRVGVRAYSQTTGVWVRGLLQNQFGVDLTAVTWITFEAAHVAEYTDPAHVERAPAGASIASMLADGSLDAAIVMDPDLDPELARPLFPDADRLSMEAFGRDAILPVNHVLAIDTATAAELPGVNDELYVLFERSKAHYDAQLSIPGCESAADVRMRALGDIVGGDPNPMGLAANRASCDRLLTYARQQDLLARDLSVDELFSPAST